VAPGDTIEQGLLQHLLHIGGVAADLFLQAQGNGDLGSTVRTAVALFNRHAFMQSIRFIGPDRI
jgi:hypothetical protein